MCKALRSRGLRTLIVTTDADGRSRLAVRHGMVVPYDDTDVLFFRRQASEAFKISIPLARWLSRHVRDFDIVHIHAVFNHSSLAAARTCRAARVPYLVRPLGTLDPWSFKQKRFRKRLLWIAGARRLLHSAAAVHYTTAAEQHLVEGRFGTHGGCVIPLGVEQCLFASRNSSQAFRGSHPEVGDAPYVLFLGRLHHKKWVSGLIQGFLAATSSPPLRAWRLVIAGDGDASYVQCLRGIAGRGGEAHRVLFTGWLDGPERVAAMRGASLLALISHQENFGLAAAEAMACGVPVLVSEQVNLADDIRAANAGWVTALDATALADSLRVILHDDAERAERGARAATLARSRFTWTDVAETLERTYAEIIARHAHSLTTS